MIERLGRFVRSDWGLYAVRAAIVGLQFGTALVLALMLGAAEFGNFAVLWSAALLGSSIISLGAPGLLLRELPARQAQGIEGLPLGATLSITLLGPAVLAAVLALAYHFGADALRVAGLSGPIVLLGFAGAILVAAVALSVNLLASVSVFLRLAYGPSLAMFARDATPHVMLLVAAFGLWLAGRLSAMTLIIAFAILSALVIAVMVAAIVAGGHFRLARDAVPYQPGMLAFWLNNVAGSMTANLDVMIAGSVLAAEAVGVYAIVKRIANFVSFPQVIANWTVATAASAAHAKGETGALDAAALRCVRLAFLPAVAIAGFVLVTLPIWSWLFDLPAEPSAVLIAAILIAGNLANVFFGATFIIASQCGYERYSVAARIVSVLFTVVAIAVVWALGLLDTAALAAVTALGTALMNAIVWYVLRRRLLVDTSAMRILAGRPAGPPA